MPKKSKSDFLESLDKVPPCIVRWHAMEREGDSVRLLTNNELSAKCGLSTRTIQRLSSKKDWAGVRAEVIDQFLSGCDASLTDLEWYKKFLSEFAENNFPHVTDKRMRATVYRVMNWKLEYPK